jgi:hypothetical protein
MGITCLADDRTSTEMPLTRGDPDPGTAHFFLVRQVTPAGNGSYDAWGPSQFGGRDFGILASGEDCP